MMGKGEYVCGLEPATHVMGPRNDLLQKGLPETLPPGKTKHFQLKITILEDI
jgi:hypothetical protein